MTHAASLEQLREIDTEIRSAGEPRSLAPNRPAPSKLESIGRTLLTEHVPRATGATFVAQVARVARAQLESFPENIFWDFELMAKTMLEAAVRGSLQELADTIGGLHERFGQPPISFRYAHDFVYGFDWAKWVARKPAERRDVGPFSLEFLRALHHRGDEMLEMIANDDPKYGRLPPKAPRNPFPFSREPEHELALHLELARQGWIPVEAWRFDAPVLWDRPFARHREERATEIGIPQNPQEHC